MCAIRSEAVSHAREPDPTTGTLAFKTIGPDDEVVFFEIYSVVRAAELHLAAWDAASRAAVLRAQFEAQRRGYRDQYPDADERLILRDGAPVGWVIVDRSGTDLHGIDMALRPDEQGRGAGTAIIRSLQEEAASSGRSMTITVQRFNVRALALYLRLGFRATRETDLHIVMEWNRPSAAPVQPI